MAGGAAGAGWEDDVPPAYLKELVDYWLTSYDWREHEARLNELLQFTTAIDGQDLHFLHVRSPRAGCRAADHHPRLAGLGSRVR